MARSTAFDIHFTLRRAKSSCLRNLTNDREICRYSAICSSFNPYADNAISSIRHVRLFSGFFDGIDYGTAYKRHQ